MSQDIWTGLLIAHKDITSLKEVWPFYIDRTIDGTYISKKDTPVNTILIMQNPFFRGNIMRDMTKLSPKGKINEFGVSTFHCKC